ncbi:MAG: M1 family aminopeptidase [Polyangiaceae bacterium]
MKTSLLCASLALVLLSQTACGDDDESPTGGAGPSSGPGSGGSGNGGAATGASGGDGGAGPTGDIIAEVQRYDLVFDLSAKTATSTLTLDVSAPGGDCLTIASELPATAASFDDAALEAADVTHDGSSLHACGPSLSAGAHSFTAEAALVAKTFHGLDVGLSVTDDFDGNDFTYLLSWVGGCDHFGACDDDPSRLVELTYEIAHPAGTTALCPGKLTAGETSTTCEVLGTRAPTYSAYAAMTNPGWARTPFVEAGGVEVVFYETEKGTIADSLDPVSVGDFLDWITGLLGPLPYGDELRFAGAPTVWLGFEHPANIVLLEDIDQITTSYENTTMHVFMHEIIHQWAGDRSTLATTQDFAWKEATAEYLAYVFEDEQRPPAEAASSLEYWDLISLQAVWHVRPTDMPAPEAYEFYGDVYGPGPMLLYVQLEALLGRDAVLAGIAAFLDQPGARSVDDLRVALEAESGADLAAYFDAWVVGSGAPTYPSFTVVATPDGGGNVTLTVTQAALQGAPFPCAVEIDVVGPTGTVTAVADFGLAPADGTVEVTIPFTEAVQDTLVDPRHRIVDVPSGANLAQAPRHPVWIF